LAEANGIDRQQEQIQKKSRDVSGERTKSDEECTAGHVRDAQRHHRLHQQGRDKEDGAHQGEHVGKRDVGQRNLRQPFEARFVCDVVGVEAHLNQDFCDAEMVRRRIKNAV
jgi:hypothetical protein